MRRLKRGTSGSDDLDAGTGVADVVLQLGENKIPLKAEKFLGATVRVSANQPSEHRHPTHPGPHPAERASEEERIAIEAFNNMRANLAPANPSGKWTPWSPDDFYQHNGGQSHTLSGTGGHYTSDSAHWATSNANTSDQSNTADHLIYASQQQTSPSAGHNNAHHQRHHHHHHQHKDNPTIFDNLGEPSTSRQPPSEASTKKLSVSRRSKTQGHSARPKKLDLVHLLPQASRTSTCRVSSPSTSPTTVNRADYPLPPLPNEASGPGSRRANSMLKRPSTGPSVNGRKKLFDEETFDQHKLNVRRPPKGIQNWFDAWPESEDDEEDEDESDHAARHERVTRVIIPQPEPQELPADDVPPPAYSAPSREISLASEKSESYTRSLEPTNRVNASVERVTALEELDQYQYDPEAHSWDSIQSSHIGRLPPPADDAQEGAVQGDPMLSDSSFDDDDDDDDDDDLDENEDEDDNSEEDGNSELALHMSNNATEKRSGIAIHSASSVDLQGPRLRPRLQNLNSYEAPNKGSRQSSRSSKGVSTISRGDQALPTPSQTSRSDGNFREEDLLLQRLNGLSVNSRTTTGGETVFEDVDSLPAPVAHMMAVTAEEKLLLDLMRSKRAAVQQLSFSEGYETALRSEQQRLAAKRTASAERKALRLLKRRETERGDSQTASLSSPARSSSEADMRRQLSAIRKEEVEKGFQMERFLGTSLPQSRGSYLLSEGAPVELPGSNRLGSEHLPATVYSPTVTGASVSSPALTSASMHSTSEDHESLDSIKRKVDYFIATNGAVPPLNGAFKTMRRKSSRAVASMSPSPVAEEEHVPDIPIRSPDRSRRERTTTDLLATQQSLGHKASSVSMDDEPRDKSPIYPPSRNDSVAHYSGSEHAPHYSSFSSPSSPHESKPDHYYPPSSNPSPQQTTSAAARASIGTASPVSPFSNIITAASKSASSKANAYAPAEMDANRNSAGELPPGVKRVPQPNSLPRNKTFPTIATAADAQQQQQQQRDTPIPSAEEDVRAAWADLGGGSQGLPARKI